GGTRSHAGRCLRGSRVAIGRAGPRPRRAPRAARAPTRRYIIPAAVLGHARPQAHQQAGQAAGVGAHPVELLEIQHVGHGPAARRHQSGRRGDAHGAGAAVLLWQIKGKRGHVPLYWRSRKRFSFYTLIHPPLQVPRPPPRAAGRRLFRMDATLTTPAPVLMDYRRMLRRRWLLVALLSVVIMASILADFMLGPSGLGWA